MKKKSLLASGLSLSFLTLLSRVLGLVREMTKAVFLGTSGYADAFAIAFMIPNLFRRLFAENSVSVAFIPTFRTYLEDADTEEGHRAAQEFVSASFTLVTFATALVVSVGMLAAPLIVPLFYSGDRPDVLAETALLTRIMFPYLLVISVAAFFQGMLNGVKVFSPSGFTPVLFNAIVIAATYLLAPHLANPARAMSVGVLAGGTAQALFQLPFVLRSGWRVGLAPLKAVLSNAGTKKVLLLIVPTVVGMAAYQLNDVVSTALAGRSGTGIVSSLQYSLRLQELILGVFVVSISTVILPDLAALAKKEQWQSFCRMLSQAVRIIALITVPVSVYAYLCGTEIISLVYKGRSFDDESVRLTLQAFRWHIAGLFFIAANRIVSQAFYAMGNTKFPALAGILSFAVNILLALLLASPMQGGGIALALSAASAANTALLAIFLRRTKRIDVGGIVKDTVLYVMKLAAMSAIAALPVIFLLPRLNALVAGCGRIARYGVPLALTAMAFGAAGAALLALTRDPFLAMIRDKIARRTSRQ